MADISQSCYLAGMLETIHQLRAALHESRPVVYCRLVETRGSTPQKAGALMLVYADGSQAGTLGGGCVEAEVKRKAIATLQDVQASVTTFRLDHDYGWDDGLICGGRMTILMQPLQGTEPAYFTKLIELADAAEGFTEAVAFDAERTSLPVPCCVLFDGEDRPVASWGGDDQVHSKAAQGLRPIASRPRAYSDQGIAYLPLAARCPLLIVGGGHIGQAVADLAYDLDFEVWVTDDRESYVSRDRFPRAAQRIAGPCQDVLPAMTITPQTYCLIVTRGHNHDQEALYRLVERGARYVGMIGSRRKIRKIFEDLVEEGISSELLEQVYAPVGIDIGSQTVPEIAVSIAAELVAHRNTAGQIPGRPAAVTVSS